jgi:hypothetical protein
MYSIRTLGKIPPWVRVSKCRGKNVARPAPMEFSKILVKTE